MENSWHCIGDVSSSDCLANHQLLTWGTGRYLQRTSGYASGQGDVTQPATLILIWQNQLYPPGWEPQHALTSLDRESCLQSLYYDMQFSDQTVVFPALPIEGIGFPHLKEFPSLNAQHLLARFHPTPKSFNVALSKDLAPMFGKRVCLVLTSLQAFCGGKTSC